MVRLVASLLLLASASAFQSGFLGGRRIAFRGSSSQLCMKTIAVFGASGLTAQECVYQALKNGDSVVGLTRYVR